MISPQENSKTINHLWDEAYGKKYGGWAGFLKRHPAGIYFFVKGYPKQRLAADDHDPRNYFQHEGKKVQKARPLVPNSVGVQGDAQIYYIEEGNQKRYDFYHNLVIKMQDGKESFEYAPIMIPEGKISIDPRMEPEKVKFLMLTPRFVESPVWKQPDKWSPGFPNMTTVFEMFDEIVNMDEIIQKDDFIFELQTRIYSMQPDLAEMLAQELKCMPLNKDGDLQGKIKFNLKKEAAKNSSLMSATISKLQEGKLILTRAIDRAVISKHEGGEWRFKGQVIYTEPSAYMTHDERFQALLDFVYRPEKSALLFEIRKSVEGEDRKNEAKNNGVPTRNPPGAKPTAPPDPGPKPPEGAHHKTIEKWEREHKAWQEWLETTKEKETA